MIYKRMKVIFLLMLLFTMFFCAQITLRAHASDVSNKSSEQVQFITELELNKNQDNDVAQFVVENMFPGDAIQQSYNVSVTCKDDVTVRFHISIKGDSKKLAEVLKTKVVLKETNETLYDGLMRDMPQSLCLKIKTDKSITRKLKYDIITYLDTSVGNEYMNQALDVDFEWWVDEVENLDSPQTGDNFSIWLWISLMFISAGGLVLLMMKKKKEDKKCDKTKKPPEN